MRTCKAKNASDAANDSKPSVVGIGGGANRDIERTCNGRRNNDEQTDNTTTTTTTKMERQNTIRKQRKKEREERKEKRPIQQAKKAKKSVSNDDRSYSTKYMLGIPLKASFSIP